MSSSDQPTAEPLAGPPPKRTRCTAHTGTGSRCQRNAMPGTNRCAQHLGQTAGKSPGRPSKLTNDVENEILKILRLGGYAETAAIAAGVSLRTYQSWIQRGDPTGTKKADARYRLFRERIEHVVAERLADNIAIINVHAKHDWKAAAWLAEREHPDKYAGPRGRRLTSSIHPDDFAAGETSSDQQVLDDQVRRDGRPL